MHSTQHTMNVRKLRCGVYKTLFSVRLKSAMSTLNEYSGLVQGRSVVSLLAFASLIERKLSQFCNISDQLLCENGGIVTGKLVRTVVLLLW